MFPTPGTRTRQALRYAALVTLLTLPAPIQADGANVYISRFWHNHQPIYWPEWNTNGSQTSRIEYAWDSIVLKNNRSYSGSNAQHPENNLTNIFGKDDRRNAYQGNPRNALSGIDARGGFAMSYSGSLIDNVRQLGALGQLGYGGDWNQANIEARNWTTPSGSPRLDLVGFTYHHSLAPLLPKEVLRKEIRIFKQAWWKAWGGNADLSDHSKGFFPTEMAFSRHIVDILREEGYEWVIVASHHLSRTCPTYFDQFDLANGNYNIFSSPPNRADLLGPSPTTGWWYAQPNPGNAAWNVAPFAYQLHRAMYVNPDTGETSTIIMVPSDDVLSYRFGYSNEGTGKVDSFITPYASDPNRPVLVMPATDGDNAWGGGSSSWFEATPQLFSAYHPTTPQDFVDAYGAAAPVVHIEDGAWIFPESDYGSPYFLKWIEPPVAAPDSTSVVPGTIVDMETPGFALKFWSWAPVITGANWVETAEQILRDEGGTVEDWKIQAPYDWDGSWTAPNQVELAWHIYLGGLDSGFNYYGGLGNDDEVKPALATTRAIQTLQPWMTDARRANDRTPPSVLKPQRFPYNPGGYTFGWFNSIPGGDTNFLKEMPSEFYIWTHAYDLSGLNKVELKIRIDNDGINPLASHQNETYVGGSEVGDWVTIPMTKRALPNTQQALNTAANHGEINYFIQPPELADYYFAKITDSTLPEYQNKLLDYYIEASDTRGNVHKSEIQHVFVEDGDAVAPPPDTPSSFELGQADEPTGYLVENPGMRIFAAVRDTTLYVATWTPSGGANDHYIFVSDSLSAATGTPAPWGKTGIVAVPANTPYLGAEADGAYAAWFNADGDPQIWRSNDPGGRVEGVIDLVDTFGTVPERLYLSAAAYGTEDGASLAAQAPEGNGDGNIDAQEFFTATVDALRDSTANGVYDRMDPKRDFRSEARLTRGAPRLSWPVAPGRSYHVWRSNDLGDPNAWTRLNPEAIQAESGEDTLQFTDESATGGQNFYKIEAF